MNVISALIVFLIGLVIGLIFARSYIVGRMRRRRNRYNHYYRQRRGGVAFSQSIFVLIICFIVFSAFSKHKARSDVAKSRGNDNRTEIDKKDRPATDVTSVY